MEKEFIPYEQALALKELGFDDNCLAYYLNPEFNSKLKLGEGYNIVTRYFRENEMSYNINNNNFLYGTSRPPHLYNLVTCPTYAQAFRWIREKYKLESFIQPLIDDDDIQFYIFAYGNISEEISHDDYDYLKHEEAELECLKKLIEIIKNK
jgi:hypothetical protein